MKKTVNKNVSKNVETQRQGEILRSLRKEKGIFIQEAAEKMGIPMSTYQAYELGYRVPSIANQKKLSAFYGKDRSYLLGYSDIENSDEIIKANEMKPSPEEMNLLNAYRDASRIEKDTILVLLGLAQVKK